MTGVEKYAHKIVKKIRFRIPDVPGGLGRLAMELGEHGAVLGDITKIEITSNYMVRDIVVFFDNGEHFLQTVREIKKLRNYKILSIQDEVLRLHKGGKIAMTPRIKVETLTDLRMIYTPGVAQVCHTIVNDPELAREYTSIGNTVCIATNGSAVLGLGDIGVLAGMPVMEGKSIILNKMSGVSCVPLLIDSDNADRIIDVLAGVSKTFSLIMIEDIKAPLCFDVEKRLQEKVSIPVFHDDQHGTATVILAALIKALRLTRKKKESVSVVINGAGAAGMETAKTLLHYGFKDLVLCDRAGAIYKGRKNDMNPYKTAIAESTNSKREKGSLPEVLEGKDVFIGVSSAGLVTQDMVRKMSGRPVVFALANPVPEIWPKEAVEAGAAVALDGRAVNNALAFPGIIRGALEARARRVTYAMKIAAAEILASLTGKNEVVPNFMNLAIHKKVAEAVRRAALNNKKEEV